MNAFIDELKHQVSILVQESLASQNVLIPFREVEGLIDNKLRELAKQLVKQLARR